MLLRALSSEDLEVSQSLRYHSFSKTLFQCLITLVITFDFPLWKTFSQYLLIISLLAPCIHFLLSYHCGAVRKQSWLKLVGGFDVWRISLHCRKIKFFSPWTLSYINTASYRQHTTLLTNWFSWIQFCLRISRDHFFIFSSQIFEFMFDDILTFCDCKEIVIVI